MPVSRLLHRSVVRTAAKPEQSQTGRYGIAVLAVFLSYLLTLCLNLWIPMRESPFLAFFGAVMVSAWCGGIRAGILATLLSAGTAFYFFILPTHAGTIFYLPSLARLTVFMLLASLISLLTAVRQQLIKELQQERDLISAVVNTAGSLIVVLDCQGRIIKFNRTCERTTGYAFQEVRGKSVWDLFIPPEEIDAVEGVFQDLCHGTFPNEYEGFWLTRWGDRRCIVWSNTILQDSRGNVRYVIGTGIDITERKRVEDTLQETNQALQALIQASPLSITVLDRQGRVKLWNPAAETLFGWREAEVIGQPLPSIPEDKWDEFQTNLMATLRGDLVHGMETYRQRKDKSLIQVGLWTAVLRGNEAENDSVISMMADLSDRYRAEAERQRAEAALKLNQARLTSFVESNIIGIIFGDLQGGIHQANDAFLQMVGYSREELNRGELRWVDITPAEYLPLEQQHMQEAYERGACTPYEKEYVLRDGRRVPVLVGYTLLEDEEPREAIAFILDLTERKCLEQTLRNQTEELVQANRMKDEFLAVLSHELRTPLNSILGWSRLLRTRQFDADTISRALETIERNARLQAQLIEDILDVSKIIRGKLRLQPQPVDLVPVIERAIEAMRPAAAAKAIQLTCCFEPKVNKVMGDPNRLQQIVWNLLSNAIKFTPQEGHVEVSLSVGHSHWSVDNLAKRFNIPNQESVAISLPPSLIDASSQFKTYAQITVTDTGKGISADFLPFVFDRFRQADSSTTRHEGGLGLGLAIVRHLVELHGGTVAAASPGLGMGSTFTVKLPVMGDRPFSQGVPPDQLLGQHSSGQNDATVLGAST